MQYYGISFKGTKMSLESEIVDRHIRRYLVIQLNFLGMPSNFESAFCLLWQKIGYTFREHGFLLESEKLDTDKKTFSRYLESSPWNERAQNDLENSLVYLTEFLEFKRIP